MKIAILTSGFFPVIDGVTVTVFNRVKRLSQLGHQVLLLCPDYRSVASLYPNWQTYVGEIFPGVTVLPLESAAFMGLAFDRNVKKTAYPQLLEALAEFRPDLVHVDEPERLQLGFDKIPAVDFAQRYGVPCVSFLHTNFIDYLEDYFTLPAPIIHLMQAISKRIVARIYNAYTLTLISSQTTYDKAVKIGIKNAVKAELLGVNLAEFDPALKQDHFFERTYQIPTKPLDAKVKLLFLGRLTPDKGWRSTLRALGQMARSQQYQELLHSVALIIAGDGSMRDEIDQALSDLPCAVHFLGRIDPTAVPALLLNSDIHVTASEKETRGLTLLEAFAAGIPVLAPRAGGVLDSLESGQTGLLFRPQDAADFAAKLQQLVADPALRQQMGVRGRAVAAALDWDVAVARLLEIWQQQLERAQIQQASV